MTETQARRRSTGCFMASLSDADHSRTAAQAPRNERSPRPAPVICGHRPGLGPEWLGNSGPSAMLCAGAARYFERGCTLGSVGEATNRDSATSSGRRRGHRMIKRRELLLLLGSAMTAAPGLRAQQKAMPVIGYLASGSPGPFAPFAARVPPGSERNRLRRGTKRGDRIPLRRGSV